MEPCFHRYRHGSRAYEEAYRISGSFGGRTSPNSQGPLWHRDRSRDKGLGVRLARSGFRTTIPGVPDAQPSRLHRGTTQSWTLQHTLRG